MREMLELAVEISEMWDHEKFSILSQNQRRKLQLYSDYLIKSMLSRYSQFYINLSLLHQKAPLTIVHLTLESFPCRIMYCFGHVVHQFQDLTAYSLVIKYNLI